MSDSTETGRREIEERLVSRAVDDPSFRQRLLDDPHGAVRDELGVELPSDVTVSVLEETPDRLYLVLPPADHGSASPALSDDELEGVAGGRAASSVTTCDYGAPGC